MFAAQGPSRRLELDGSEDLGADRGRSLGEMTTPRSPGDEPNKQLTIAELVPADDLIAQWAFSLTAFAEDLQVGIKPAKEAMEAGDLRALLFWQRHMVTRLFEARRLVTSARAIEDIGETGGLKRARPGDIAARVRRRVRSGPQSDLDLPLQTEHGLSTRVADAGWAPAQPTAFPVDA
jgi:hypothetical protein